MAVPAVLAQAGDGDHQDTVDVCHAVGGGAYLLRQARETDFYGSWRQTHGTDRRDIVAPFVIENPRPDDPSSFPGRNWSERGQEIYNAGCDEEEPVLPPEPDKKIRICHATSSSSNPYVSNEPAIGNNGDLHGGHLNHTGPVYPAGGWGDVIPPYPYLDTDGNVQVFPGYNWTPEGQAIYENGCEPPAPPRPTPVVPSLGCVEALGEGQFLAHYGYLNPNPTTIEPPAEQNSFSPPPANRGQPTAFASGRVEDAFQVQWDGGDLTWHLMGNELTVGSGSRKCQGSITVVKRLDPADDPGRFNLKIDGEVVAAAVGDEGTGTVAVESGRHVVGESAAPGTSLSEYHVDILCRDDARQLGAGDSDPSTTVQVRRGSAIVCTITNRNRRNGTPEPPNPPEPNPPNPPNPPEPQPPVPPGPLLDLVVTKSAEPTVVRVGGRITWTMTVTNNSSVAAAEVNGLKLDDPRSFRTKLISLTSSQGTCRPFTCDLGRLAPGASATVVAVTEALDVGTVVDVVRVSSEEVESNYRNNVAAALVRVVGPLRVLGVIATCRTLTATPRVLEARRTSTVRLEVRNRLGKPVAGLLIRAAGAGVRLQARTDRQGVARMEMTPSRVGLVLFASGGRRAPASRAAPTCVTTLGVLRARPTQVTG